jgi:hypothetical protein
MREATYIGFREEERCFMACDTVGKRSGLGWPGIHHLRPFPHDAGFDPLQPQKKGYHNWDTIIPNLIGKPCKDPHHTPTAGY